MKALMFGPGSRQLFGLFHPGQGAASGDQAVLVIPPFGQEALRSHRLAKVLADRLARSGTAALRFDFHGAGDSPGDDADGELEGWRRDVCVAHEELQRRSGATRISWVGIRLGATVAVTAARSGRCDPVRLALWEPILDGPAYARYLRSRHVEALDASFCLPDPAARRLLAREPDTMPQEALGTEISPELQKQLAALSPASLDLTALHDTVVVAPPTDQVAAQWVARQQQRQMPVRLDAFSHPLDWSSDPHPNSAMVPAEALRKLLSCLDD